MNANWKAIIVICGIFVLLRVGVSLIYVDLNKDYYWEYGEIAKNIRHGKGFSLFHYDGKEIKMNFEEAARPYPSAYMPPGYVMYLLPFMSIKSVALRNFLIILIQTLIASMVVIVVYHFTKMYFSRTSALIAGIIVALFPEFVYATYSYTPTVFYHLTVMIVLCLLYERVYDVKKLIAVALLVGLTVYMRSEFVLFAFFVAVSLFILGHIKASIILGGIIILLILPWQIRNYRVFGNHWVPFATSFGLNFYRGHNPYGVGDWTDDDIMESLEASAERRFFESDMNDIYIKHATAAIKSDPGREVRYTFSKIADLWLINLRDIRTKNLIYAIPWFMMLFLFFVGITKTWSWSTHGYAYLFFLYSTVIAVVFLAQPRYQTMMKIVCVPFAACGAESIYCSLLKVFSKRRSA